MAAQLRNGFYGGRPIQMGLCNGHNGPLNCLEYHRDSEVDIFADEAVNYKGEIHSTGLLKIRSPVLSLVQKSAPASGRGRFLVLGCNALCGKRNDQE